MNIITLRQKSDGRVHVARVQISKALLDENQHLKTITKKKMINILKKAGFKTLNYRGSYDL